MKFCKKLRSKVKGCDYFGVGQSLRVKGEEKYKSLWGGLSFVLFLFVSLGYFVYSLFGFASRSNMAVYQNELVVMPVPQLNLSALNYNFAFSLLSEGNTLDTNQLNMFDVSLVQQQIKNQTNTQINQIELRKCSYSDFAFLSKTEFDKLFLKNFLCMDTNNFIISGFETDDLYQELLLSVKLKESTLTNENEKQNLKNILQHSPIKASIYFTDTFINVGAIKNPVNNFLNSYATYLDYFQNKKVDLNYMSFIFQDDSSFLFSDPFTSSFIKFFSGRDYGFSLLDRTTRYPDDSNLLSIYFKSNPNKRVIWRIFQKLPDFLAYVISLLSTVLFLFSFFATLINEFKLSRSIINKIMRFREAIIEKKQIVSKLNLIVKNSKPENEELHINSDKGSEMDSFHSEKKIINIVSKNELRKSLVIESINSRKEVAKNMQNLQNNIALHSDKPIKVSFWKYTFCSCRKKSSTQVELFNKGQNQLNHYIDVYTIIKKLQEIDLFKSILFNKDQINLINFLSKPIISVDSGNEGHYYDETFNKQLDLTEEELEEVRKSYINITTSDSQSEYNRLIKFFNDKIKLLI